MGQVTWSPAALEDIEAIAAYITIDSEDEAARFVVRLTDATRRLEEFPESGRIIPELHKRTHREILVGDYRIMYQIEDGNVWINGVIHGSRDYSRDR
jgi:addiction module RelE/StbE family toxin